MGNHYSEFETYAKDRERKITRTLSHIETRGAAAALDRCRVLANQIKRDFRNKKLRLLNNPSLLAEFQVSIERAASVLDGIAARKMNGYGRAETRSNSSRDQKVQRGKLGT
jgi:hypothetical protein